MQSYKFRVTHKRVELRDVLVILPLEQPYIYASEMEGTENYHTHFLIQTDLTTHAIRARLKKINLSGNEDYSLVKLKEQYPVEYLAYLIKGKEYVSTLPDDVLQTAISYDTQVKTELKERKKKKSFMQQIEEGYIEWSNNRYPLAKGQEWNHYSGLTEYIMERHKEEERPVRVYQVQTIYDTLLCRNNVKYCNNFQVYIQNRYDLKK